MKRSDFLKYLIEELKITLKSAINLHLNDHELESPVEEFRKRYTYLNDETLDQAVVECPELVQRLISDEKVSPLARSHALLALAAGAEEKEVFYPTIKASAMHPSSFIRESAFMGLFEFYDQDQGKHLELKKFFQESLEKEKVVGIKQKIVSLLEIMSVRP